jgi:cation-transporting ATPase I
VRVLGRMPSARGAVGAALRLSVAGVGLAAAPAVLAAGLLGPTTRATGRALRGAAEVSGAVAAGGAELARAAAASGARAVGTVLTGSDPLPDGSPRGLTDVAKGMLEPPMARHTRRVWTSAGHAHVEIAAPAAGDSAEVRSALRRHLQRLQGVQWTTVNDVAGRVLVAFDERRVGVEDVVGVISAVEQARGGSQVFPLRTDHPGDLEPFLAAVVDAAVDVASVGAALVARFTPVPAVSRHVTLAVALLDTQKWLKEGLLRRIGPIGTDLALSGSSALLHALTQSPTVPAISAAAALQVALEMRARRQVWQRREPQLCKPEPPPWACCRSPAAPGARRTCSRR